MNCYGKYVEEMTSLECGKCQMEITQYTFLTVPDLLSWADGKINVMLCVKKEEDLPRAITTLLENNATHRAFLEIHVSGYLKLNNDSAPNWQIPYYAVLVHNDDEVIRYKKSRKLS